MSTISLQNDIMLQDEITRDDLVKIIQAGFAARDYRFVRRVTQAWISDYPGDLEAQHVLAESYWLEGRSDLALPIFNRLANIDPQNLRVQHRLSEQSDLVEFSISQTASWVSSILEFSEPEMDSVPHWVVCCFKGNTEITANEIENASFLFEQAAQEEPASPLPALLHMIALYQLGEINTLKELGNKYHQRWPDTLGIKLLYANACMQAGQEEMAVQWIHQVVAEDINGVIPNQIWGMDHPYSSMWPEKFSFQLSIAIPASVNATLGWNQLPAPSRVALRRSRHKQKNSKDTTATIEVIKEEFIRVAEDLQQSDLAQSEARFPVFIVLSSLTGLEKQYGLESLSGIDAALKDLVAATNRLARWSSQLVYVDDSHCAVEWGLTPAKPEEAWSIKHFIADLDDSLRASGEMIGAVLIVGGPDVIPFHHLPNPVDDTDMDVPSDNPYATPDENYFIPHWPVGRLPGGTDTNAADLVKSIQRITQDRLTILELNRPNILVRLFNFIFRRDQTDASAGFTAEVWQRASHAVFRTIGKPQALKISPPVESPGSQLSQKKGPELAYFNLHGLEDAPEWFGQRDPLENSDGPDYPIALRPADIINSGRAPQLVFSEACFGAHIINKNIEDAISLKFLASGSKAIVGSTCIAYGAISTPLIAADLLGKAYWSFIKEGNPAGEALRKAKIQLAKEMDKRQGYLDGEDQKTLISFVLYGDPLAQTAPKEFSQKTTLRTLVEPSSVKTVCDRADHAHAPQVISSEVIQRVKSVVREHLPGMSGAKVFVGTEHSVCTGNNCPTGHLNSKAIPSHNPQRRVVTLSKSADIGNRQHTRFARMTLDAEGKLVKLVVSR